MVAQAIGAVAVVPLCLPGLSPLLFSLSGQSLTLIGTHPLQPGLSLFFSLRCLSFPSLLLGCRSIFRSLSSTLGPVSHSFTHEYTK